MYRSIITKLNEEGYSVNVYEYTWRPLLECGPEDWPAFSSRLAGDIKKQIAVERRRNPEMKFGILGVSVGSVLAMHAAKVLPELERIMLVTMYGNSARHVWEHPSLAKMRTKLETAGLGQDGAYEVFEHVEPTYLLHLIGQRPILLYANKTDPVIRFANTQVFIDAAKREGIPLTLKLVSSSRHSFTIVKAFRDSQTWRPFFADLLK